MAKFNIKPQFDTNSAHDDSETWLISYADMVTLLLGFFVMLYSFSKVDDSKFNAVTKTLAQTFKVDQKKQTQDVNNTQSQAITATREERALQIVASMMDAPNLNQAISTLESTASAVQARKSTLAALRSEINSYSKTKSLGQTQGNENTIELVLPDELLFNVGSVSLSKEQAAKLQSLGAALAKIDNIVEVEVQGHTDITPARSFGVARSNWSVSSERAGVVAEELIRGGFPKIQMRIAGYGDTRPLNQSSISHHPNQGIISDRRVQIIIRKRNS